MPPHQNRLDTQPQCSPLAVATPLGIVVRRSSKEPTLPLHEIIGATQSPLLARRSLSRRRIKPFRSKAVLCSRLAWGLLGAASCVLVAYCLPMVYRLYQPRPLARRFKLPAPVYSNATLAAWDFTSETSVVQLIQTRFMQSQPDLMALGKARLDIFESFCLPSMLSQSSDKYIWLIRTDPLLNETLLDPLISMLKDYPNILLIGSNANPEGFRHDASVQDVSPANVWSGSYELLCRYHAAAQSRIVIETRLDADDGLHYGFVELAQIVTQDQLASPQTDWMVYCAYSHLEWHHTNPFETKVEESESGFLVGATHKGCITAGLSYVYGLDVIREDMPKGSHGQLHRSIPFCSDSVRRFCIRRANELIPTAIRARTPTSAGMDNIVTNYTKHNSLVKSPPESALDVQDEIWSGVASTFGIGRDQVAETRSSLLTNLPEIVRDNLKGQCTRGHSCKPSSQTVLKELLKGSES